MNNPVCVSCGFFKNCKSPKLPPLIDKRVDHRINESLKVMIVGSYPTYNDDQNTRIFSGAEGEYLQQFLDQLSIRWVLAMAVRCSPGKAAIKPSGDEFKHCGTFFNEDVKKHKPQVLIALGKWAYAAVTGMPEEKVVMRDTAKPVLVGDKWVIGLMHPSNHVNGRNNLTDEYWRAFERVEALANGTYDHDVDKVPPYEIVRTIDRAMEVSGDLFHDIWIDNEYACNKKSPKKKTLFHPKARFICSTVGTITARGVRKYYLFTPEALSKEVWEAILRGRRFTAYNCYAELASIIWFYKLTAEWFHKNTTYDDTFLQFFLADQSNHHNSLKKRSMHHLDCRDWSTGVWGYLEDLAASRRKELAEVRKHNKKCDDPVDWLEEPDPEVDFGDLPEKVVFDYNVLDVDRNIKVDVDVKKDAYSPIAYNLCLRATLALVDTANRGIPCNVPWLRAYQTAVERQSVRLQQALETTRPVMAVLTGWEDFSTTPPVLHKPAPFNVKGYKFMESLASFLNHHTGQYTETGRMKLGATELKALAGIDPPLEDQEKEEKHRIFAACFRIRQNRDLCSKFLSNLIEYTVDGRIHTTYRVGRTEVAGNTAGADLSGGTDSGRLASQDPNLQNLKQDAILRAAITVCGISSFGVLATAEGAEQ